MWKTWWHCCSVPLPGMVTGSTCNRHRLLTLKLLVPSPSDTYGGIIFLQLLRREGLCPAAHCLGFRPDTWSEVLQRQDKACRRHGCWGRGS